MIAIRRILCPIDFSAFSEHALDHAVAIARWYGSAVTLFHVYAIVPMAVYPAGAPILPSELLTERVRADLMAGMKRLAEGAARAGVAIECEIGEGNPAREILARANTPACDLLVMGTHGASGFDRLVFGSVTEKVLRKASCPVLSVPPAAGEHRAVPFTRILCALDFSDCSLRALDYATSLAQEGDARLTVVHVIEVPSAAPVADYLAGVEADHRQRLEDAVRARVREFSRVEPILAIGKPSREVLRLAGEQQSDLVVIGIQGRGASDLLFFGSVAQHVVRHASCPVLTLRTG